MEENRQEEIHITKTNNEICNCKEHPLLKGLLIGLLIFLGAFCASYVVIDWHMKSMRPFNMMPSAAIQMEKQMEHDFNRMDKILKSKQKLAIKNSGIIQMEQSPVNYTITIDLRAFDNNENNVQVTTNGNILTINGRSIRKTKHDEQISEFQQNYMFGNNVKLEDLTKETKGNYLIISIPINNEND